MIFVIPLGQNRKGVHIFWKLIIIIGFITNTEQLAVYVRVKITVTSLRGLR